MVLSDKVKDVGFFYDLNSVAMFMSFVMARFGGNGAALVKIYLDYDVYAKEIGGLFAWNVSIGGMLLLNLYNFIFFKDLIKSEMKLISSKKTE